MKHWLWVLVSLTLLVPAVSMAGDTDFGDPLPVDGGAPFSAYQMHLEAIHSADWESYKVSAPPHEVDAQIAEAGSEAAAEAEFQEFSEFLAMLTPIAAGFVEGRADDQRALIWVRATILTQGGDEIIVDRNVEMVHADGRWYLENESPR